MTRATALVLVINILVGWFASALFVGVAIQAAFVVALGIAVAIWILKVAARPDVVYAAIGLAIGVVLGLVSPSLSLDSIGPDPLIQALGLFIFVMQA